jgi:hypothetical protein
MRVNHGPTLAASLLGLALLTVGGAAQAHHNDWAAPLVGGALGGYALGTLVADQKPPTEKIYETPAPVYYAPAPTPVYVPPSTASIEARLKQLDALAAGGYITPQEYQTRRTQILNGA